MAFVYADKATILLYHDKRIITQLTNDDDTVDYDDEANIVDGVLEAMENEAAQTIDNHLRYRYDVPLTGSDITKEIVRIDAALTWCNLWERKGEEPDQVTALRERMLGRLEEMGKLDSQEVRGERLTTVMAARSKTGKVRTIFDESGYFDGLVFRGTRQLAGDEEN